MKYFSEVSNIVSGALSGDRKLVISYTQMLCEKLEADGAASSDDIARKFMSIRQLNDLRGH